MSATMRDKFITIRNKIGPLPDDEIDKYLEQLRAESLTSDDFQQYLEWAQAEEESHDPVLLPPETWLEELNTADLSDVLTAIDIRSALSFKEVDHLLLATDEDGNCIYFVTSEPAALKLDRNPESEIPVHPALLCLSASNTTQLSPPPKLVLPVGRLRCGNPNTILQNVLDRILQRMRMNGEEVEALSLGEGTLPTPLSYFQDSLHNDPELMNYLDPSQPEKEALVEYFENLLLYKALHHRSDWDADFTNGRALEPKSKYTQRIINVLRGNVPEITCDKLERKRRELWQAVLRSWPDYTDTNYVVVVDVTTPGLPIWAIYVQNQMEAMEEDELDSEMNMTSTESSLREEKVSYAVQIFDEAREWLNSYGKLDSKEIANKIENPSAQYSVMASTINIARSEEMFAKAREI